MFTMTAHFILTEKPCFSDTYLNIGDASSYAEWEYKTGSGQKVSLALGDTKALVIADLKNSYVVINVLSGNSMITVDVFADKINIYFKQIIEAIIRYNIFSVCNFKAMNRTCQSLKIQSFGKIDIANS